MSFGSVAPQKASLTRLVFATTEAEQACLRQRSQELELRFRTAPTSTLVPDLLDLRQVHITLYDQLCPTLPIAVGTFRGTQGTALATARREVRVANATGNTRSIDPCLEPHLVMDRMHDLYKRIEDFVAVPHQHEALENLSSLTHAFLTIHPFLDGNGHTWRLALLGLARICRLTPCLSWTVHQRPFGSEFSSALQSYPSTPDHLINVLGRYFD